MTRLPLRMSIDDTLRLPVETATQAIAILAKRRVGKSYTARRLVEQLHEAGQQVVIADPKGDWWGVRSSADGKGPGLPIVILGGERGDVPLEATGGEVVAQLVVEERVSALLDLSHLRKGQVAKFMTDFLETLYRLKAREALRTPMMLVLDEADAIAPQKPMQGEERMLGAAEDIVRRGGQRGIGCTLITQRTAVLNKNVLTQCEMIIALRTIAPQDLKAMRAWIDVHGEEEQRDVLMASLPSLPVGDAWFWSPGWPTAAGIFARVTVAPIVTFDSGATPRAGEKRVEPKTVAHVDLAALERRMAATVERRKAEDPKLLRAELERLRRERADSQPDLGRLRAELTAMMRDLGQRLLQSLAGVETEIDRLEALRDRVMREQTDAYTRLRGAVASLTAVISSPTTSAPTALVEAVPRQPPSRGTTVTEAVCRPSAENGLTPSDAKVLNAIALAERLGAEVTRTAVGFFAGYREGGRYTNVLGALKTRGLIDYPAPGRLCLTPAGAALAHAGAARVQTLKDLHALWLGKLPPSERKVLTVLLDAHPEALTRADLGERTDYREGGRFTNVVGRLHSLGAVEYPAKGLVRASDALFPKGLP